MKNILCIGGSGHLGKHVINLFAPYNVINVDFKQHELAKQNIIINKELTLAQNNQNTIDTLKKMNIQFNAILVTAGGWAGGNIKDNDYFEKVKLMN